MTSNEQLQKLCALSKYNSFIGLPSLLYHYTKDEHLTKIILKDSIVLQMTNINDFSDKQEGKVIERFYQTALRSLKDSYLIDKNDWEELSQLSFSNDRRFLCYNNEQKSLERKNHDVYVFCFSKNKNDPKMLNNYSKSDLGPGYCIEFFTSLFKSLAISANTHPNISFSLADVLYEDKAIIWLRDRILEVIKNTENYENPNSTWRKPIFQQLLKELSYSTKNKEFEYEKEIRLIAFCPADFCNELKTPFFSIYRDEEIEKDRLCICFNHSVLSDYFRGDLSSTINTKGMLS